MRIIAITGFLLLASLLPFSANADQVALAEDAPHMYLVKDGDTLWGIANTFLRDPWRWPDLWDINEQLDNPHLIFPGDQLYLVYVDGQPRLRVRRGAESRTVKLSPQMRIEPLDKAIPVIPLEDIQAWLTGNRVVTPPDLDSAPYVVASDQRHLLTASGGLFYARGLFPEEETGYGIYRRGETYVDPLTKEVLGLRAQDIGSAILRERHDDDVVQLEVTRINEEVRNGDRLLPNESRNIAATFEPHAPEEDVAGLMIAVDGGVSQIGVLDVVAINLGWREGMAAGQVLAIFQTGEIVRDAQLGTMVQMPDTRAGLLLVFRPFEKMSYGIVLKASRPLAVMDRVAKP
jgi:hypothetical protein